MPIRITILGATQVRERLDDFEQQVRAAVRREDPRRGERLRRLRLVERMDRLAIDGGGAVSRVGEEYGDAVPEADAS